jgi:hypothetical protein
VGVRNRVSFINLGDESTINGETLTGEIANFRYQSHWGDRAIRKQFPELPFPLSWGFIGLTPHPFIEKERHSSQKPGFWFSCKGWRNRVSFLNLGDVATIVAETRFLVL